MKSLEALEKLDHTICMNVNEKTLQFNIDKDTNADCNSLDEFIDCYETIEQSLKALEIIKNKKVNVGNIKYCFFLMLDKAVYNKTNIELTQEEYDLLKEVLKDE